MLRKSLLFFIFVLMIYFFSIMILNEKAREKSRDVVSFLILKAILSEKEMRVLDIAGEAERAREEWMRMLEKELEEARK